MASPTWGDGTAALKLTDTVSSGPRNNLGFLPKIRICQRSGSQQVTGVVPDCAYMARSQSLTNLKEIPRTSSARLWGRWYLPRSAFEYASCPLSEMGARGFQPIHLNCPPRNTNLSRSKAIWHFIGCFLYVGFFVFLQLFFFLLIFTHLKCRVQQLSVFTELRDHHRNLNFRIFSTAQK